MSNQSTDRPTPNMDMDDLAPSTRRPGALRTLLQRSQVAWRLFWDQRVSLLAKIIPVAGLVYIVSPVDLAPAWLMGPLAPLGTLDDIGVALLALNLFIQASPAEVVQEHLKNLGAFFETSPMNMDDVVDGEAQEIVD